MDDFAFKVNMLLWSECAPLMKALRGKSFQPSLDHPAQLK
jgi:hypothetical protein